MTPAILSGCVLRLLPVRSSRKWVVYTLIRVGIFAVALAVLILLGINVWLSAVVAAVVGLCASYIFLRGPRDAVAKSIVEMRGADERSRNDRDEDNEVENELLDRFESDELK